MSDYLLMSFLIPLYHIINILGGLLLWGLKEWLFSVKRGQWSDLDRLCHELFLSLFRVWDIRSKAADIIPYYFDLIITLVRRATTATIIYGYSCGFSAFLSVACFFLQILAGIVTRRLRS